MAGFDPPRTPALSTDAMVVSNHTAVSSLGLATLRAGGNAADAAIATQLVLNLVEPQSSGIGRGAFILHWDAEKAELRTYDGRETAPAAARPDRFLQNGSRMPFGKAEMTADNKAELDKFLARLRKATKARGPVQIGAVVVTGHTDRIGSLKYNMKLSERRAVVVKDYLVSAGVDEYDIAGSLAHCHMLVACGIIPAADGKKIARGLAEERKATLVPPYDDPFIIAGQGTAGREIMEDLTAFGLKPDIAVIGASGGGLAAGIIAPATRLSARTGPPSNRWPRARHAPRRTSDPGRRSDRSRSTSATARSSRLPGPAARPPAWGHRSGSGCTPAAGCPPPVATAR